LFILTKPAFQILIVSLAYNVVRIFFLLQPEGTYFIITDALEF